MKKKIFLMLPCIAAVAIATLVGKKTMESNAFKSNDLLAQNVEALTSTEDGGYDDVGCSGLSIYAAVKSSVGEAQTRVHFYGSVGGDDGIDEVYDVDFKRCHAEGNGNKNGSNYESIIKKGPSTYVKCEGKEKHGGPNF